MKRKQYPVSYLRWFGKMAIILTGADKEPKVVFIKGCNMHGCLIAKEINTSSIRFSTPLRCIEYSQRLYERLLTQSQYRRAAGEFGNQKRKLLGTAPRPNPRCPTEVNHALAVPHKV